MHGPALRTATLGLVAGLALSACESDGYGYGGVAVGYGYPGYGDGYYDDYWDYYAPRPYWGWYDDYYYPGTGIYIYDRNRRARRWDDRYRRYWTERRGYWRNRDDWRERGFRDNWRDFRGRTIRDRPYLQDRRRDGRRWRKD